MHKGRPPKTRALIRMWILLLPVLAGCVPHSLPLYSGTAERVDIDGSTFLVRWTSTRAEATRISPEHRPDRRVMLSLALRAIEAASGCDVQPGTLYGDTTLTEAYLACPDSEPERLQPRLTHRPHAAEI